MTQGGEKGLHKLIQFVGPSLGVQPLLTFGISIIIARALGPEGRGVYGLVVATNAVLPMLIGVGLNNAVRYWSARGDVDSGSLLKTSTFLALGIGTLCAVIAFVSWSLGRPTWLVPPDLSPIGAASMVGALALAPLRGFWGGYLMGHERYGYTSWGTNAASAFQLAVLAALWLLTEFSLDAVLIAFLIQFIFSFVLFFFFAGREIVEAFGQPFLSLSEVRKMFGYGSWLYLSGLMEQTNSRANIFILAALGDLYATGLFAAALGPASLVAFPAAPLASVLSARTTRRTADANFSLRVAGALRLVFMMTVAIAIAAAVIAPVLLPMVFGERFDAAVVPFWLLLPGTIAFSLVRIVLPYMAGAKHQYWNARISATGAFLTVVLNVLLVPSYGASGAALASSLAYGCMLGIAIVAFLRVGDLSIREFVSFRASDWEPLLRIFGKVMQPKPPA